MRSLTGVYRQESLLYWSLNVLSWLFSSYYNALKGIPKQFNPGLIWGIETILKSLPNLYAFGYISQPLAGKHWSQTAAHTWDSWLEECVCAMLLSISGMFSRSPGCVEVLLQARSTLKPHVSVFLSYRHVIPAALNTDTRARRCRKVKTSRCWLSWFHSMWKIHWLTEVLEIFIGLWNLS